MLVGLALSLVLVPAVAAALSTKPPEFIKPYPGQTTPFPTPGIVEQALGPDCAHIDLMAIVETARGLENVNAITCATPQLKALVFGSADFSFGIGASLRWEPLQYARARIVTAARAANLHVVDSALFDISDAEGLREEAALAKNLGFSGKAAIHPRQVEATACVRFHRSAAPFTWAA